MKHSSILRRGFGLMVAMTAAVASVARADGTGKGDDTAGGSGTTVTRTAPPSSGDDWTPEKMRAAKPMPLPSINAPPVPQQPGSRPSTGPQGVSPPGLGGPAHP